MAEVAVGLVGPMREMSLHREIFSLVDVAAAQAAGVRLLQPNDVETANQVRDAAVGPERSSIHPVTGETITIADFSGIATEPRRRVRKRRPMEPVSPAGL